MAKKKILMVCEAYGGGVFTYVSQLCNDMVDEFDIYLAYSLRPQTPKNYKDFLDQRVHLIEMKNVGVKGLTNFKSDIAAIKELRQIEKEIQPDVIHLHSSVAGGLGRLAYKEKNNTVVYTPHGYAHILMGPGKKSKVYKFAEKVLGNRALTLTCCESEDEEAKKFSKRTAHVETGVNLSDLSASLDGIKSVKNDKFTVFTLGRACVQKQPQLFNRIAELVPDTELDDTLDKYPYCDALKKADGSCLTKSQKVFVYFLKKRNYGMLKFLVDGRIWLKNIKGARLK